MANRTLGTFNIAANFEVGAQAPFDARLTTPEYPQLTDGSIPLPYLGMLVAVTEDENRTGGDVANNGLYLLTAADATLTASWTKIGGSGVTITSVDDEDELFVLSGISTLSSGDILLVDDEYVIIDDVVDSG